MDEGYENSHDDDDDKMIPKPREVIDCVIGISNSPKMKSS